jgi:hypothetical protein
MTEWASQSLDHTLLVLRNFIALGTVTKALEIKEKLARCAAQARIWLIYTSQAVL